MPTGYTANVPEITFEQFVWQCARGMGAFITMRDEPSDAEIPSRFEPSDYHSNKLFEARERLDELFGMSLTDAEEKCANEHEKHQSDNTKQREECEKRINAYRAMLESVRLWEPPTADHDYLKKFMIEQLEKSIDFDDVREFIEEKPALTAREWLCKEVKITAESITHHFAEDLKEIERVESRNEWIAALRQSLSDSE